MERSLHGPTGWAEAMVKRGHWHDRFWCPHSQKGWHKKALDLYLAIEETPSPSVAALMRKDLEEMVRRNLPPAEEK